MHKMDHVEFHPDHACGFFLSVIPSEYHHLNRQYKGKVGQKYLLNILIRALICTALTTLLRPVMARLLSGKNQDRATPRNREVKSF